MDNLNTTIPQQTSSDSSQNLSSFNNRNLSVDVPPNPQGLTNKSDNNTSTNNFEGVVEKKKGGLFNIIIVLLLIVALMVWGGVGFLYYQNIQMDNKEAEIPQEIITPQPTITYQYEIQAGNIVRISTEGEEMVLVDKSQFKTTGVTGFSKVVLSPDKNSLCFESWPPSLDPSIYLSGSDGSNVQKVMEKRQNCSWSPDSLKIAYVTLIGLDQPADIFVYDLRNRVETNLTNVDSTKAGKYLISGWADENTILCSYQENEVVSNCSIDVTAQTVTIEEYTSETSQI